MPFFQQAQSGQVCWEGGGGCQDGRVTLPGMREEMSRWAAVATPTETGKQTQPARKEVRKEATSPAERSSPAATPPPPLGRRSG